MNQRPNAFLSVLTVFSLLFFSCTAKTSPEETIHKILNLTAEKNFSALAEVAPFWAELSLEDQIKLADTLTPYCSGTREMEVKKLSLKSVNVFLSTGKKEDKVLILPLIRDKDWILSGSITYRQSFDFIPLKKEE